MYLSGDVLFAGDSLMRTSGNEAAPPPWYMSEDGRKIPRSLERLEKYAFTVLADGQVLRFTCTALPDGGRMLSYTPVTDLVRHSDDPGSADYYRALRGSTRSLARHLGAAE